MTDASRDSVLTPSGTREVMEIAGAPALSGFRISKLLENLRRCTSILGVDSAYLHFAQIDKPLTDHETDVLRRLLTYGPTPETTSQPDPDKDGTEEVLLVVPRPGTISPWSSKATDIANICGLHAVVPRNPATPRCSSHAALRRSPNPRATGNRLPEYQSRSGRRGRP